VRPYLESAAGGPFTAVALMREPQEWLGSWYRFYQKSEHADGPRSTRGLTFERFVQDWCSDTPPPYADFGTQSAFLASDTPDAQVDHLFRYADIEQFVHLLEDRLQCEIILPQVNVSPLAELTLSADTFVRFQRHAADDLALYATLGASR
jgi:hypothetical protein